jgi:hypothetical protein
VSLRAFQFFLFSIAGSFFFAVPLHGALSNGQRYRINFVDVDGNALSTADGHVTVLVLTTPEDRDKARTVGDRVPDYCLGNPNYRMITILDFTKRRTLIGREIATTLVRHHLDEEAKRLQVRYDATSSRSPILTGPCRHSLAHKPRRQILAYSSSRGTGNYSSTGTTYPVLKRWLPL